MHFAVSMPWQCQVGTCVSRPSSSASARPHDMTAALMRAASPPKPPKRVSMMEMLLARVRPMTLRTSAGLRLMGAFTAGPFAAAKCASRAAMMCAGRASADPGSAAQSDPSCEVRHEQD